MTGNSPSQPEGGSSGRAIAASGIASARSRFVASFSSGLSYTLARGPRRFQSRNGFASISSIVVLPCVRIRKRRFQSRNGFAPISSIVVLPCVRIRKRRFQSRNGFASISSIVVLPCVRVRKRRFQSRNGFASISNIVVLPCVREGSYEKR